MGAVKYSKGGHWLPTIPNQTCKHCGAIYAAHKIGQTYCSRSCSSSATAHRKAHVERTCPGCGVKWSAPPSTPSQYCSKNCIYESGKWTKSEQRPCEQCEAAFTSRLRKERGEWTRFCSSSCASQAAINHITKACANCGETFELQQSRKDELTCSWECRTAYYKRDRNQAWKGGLVDQGGRASRRIDRSGYAAKYEGEHRLVAAREIGRPLSRGEAVICIDQNHANINPSNLFLCPSAKERGFIFSGAFEWPVASNLVAYRVSGYVRPDAVLVIRQYELKGPQAPGRSRTRHPQADEIIERRRAGASLRDLAAAFGTSKSGMHNILRNRL